ncbi:MULTISPECIES: hypothetical protein [Mycobacteriaceae]|jgi:hypothetical protein|uniref:hypothetical protein n=1 Tax=Mycobacteriaceae TaxID=1762 RepID=UPI0003AB06D5|nr:hypothetical protein [Mycolicibacterium llatzerense]MCT7372920.1 hypothetical protein [Mycolicibacterium llatzerense]
MKLPTITAKQRMYAYGVIAAGLGVLTFYRLIDPAAIPVWLGFAGVVLGIAGNATAAVKLNGQIKTGSVE